MYRYLFYFIDFYYKIQIIEQHILFLKSRKYFKKQLNNCIKLHKYDGLKINVLIFLKIYFKQNNKYFY